LGLVFHHFFSLLFLAKQASAITEDPGHSPTEEEVQNGYKRHHDEDENQHHEGVINKFFPGGSDDLAQLIENLAQEENQPSPGASARFAFALSFLDDVSCGVITSIFSHDIPCFPTSVLLHCGAMKSQGGQDSNLQPAVLETAALPIEPPP
jgi:hypothetical protein